jgi:hypothetical protein
MKKLKLESLEVTSFATGAAGPLHRGTVLGRDAKAGPRTMFHCYPTDPAWDCTFGCTASCPDRC